MSQKSVPCNCVVNFFTLNSLASRRICLLVFGVGLVGGQNFIFGFCWLLMLYQKCSYCECLCRCLNQECLYFLDLGYLGVFEICCLLMLARDFVFACLSFCAVR